MRKYPIVWFYILAFSITWIGMIPGALGSHGIAPFNSPYVQFLIIFSNFGPALAAVLMSQVAHGKIGMRDLLKALIRWRVGLVWYIIAVLGPVVLLIAAQVITKLLSFSVISVGPLQGDLFPNAIFYFAINLFVNVEEIGWRGFALPHLQKRYNALLATLIVGMLWGLWHLPLFFWSGHPMSEYPLSSFIGIVASAFVYTWLYNSTKGSILLVALLHDAENTFSPFVPGVSRIAIALLYCVVAIGIIAVFGKTNLSRQERVRASS
jgi:uncharacterized protein